MASHPLLPGKYNSYAATRAAKLGRNRGRKREPKTKAPPAPPDVPMPAGPIQLTPGGPFQPKHIPDDPYAMKAMTALKEAVEDPEGTGARMEALARARAAVKDRVLGPVQEIEPDQAKEAGTRLLLKLVPRAIRVIHWHLDHGGVREQLVAAESVLDRTGLHKGPAVVVGGGPIILINLAGGPLPWEGQPALDVTPKR